MAKPADLSKTCGIRIGTTTLFHRHHSSGQFEADMPVYNRLYEMGFRSFQVQPGNKSDEWLRSVKQWAAGLDEETHLHTIDFLVNSGDASECPVSSDSAVVQRAKDVFQKHLAKAALCGSLSHFGPYSAGLLAGQYFWTKEHDDRCVEWFRWMNTVAEEAKVIVEVEPINRFETGVSTLGHMWMLLQAANAGKYLRMGPDTCHQGFGESSTTKAWSEHNDHFGLTGHLSDSSRSVIGAQQALTATGVFPYLAGGKCKVKTWNVEAFGKDVDPGIAAALGLRVLPKMSGVLVMQASILRIRKEFAACTPA